MKIVIKPNSEQLAAVNRFAAANGRTWREELNYCWQTGWYQRRGASADSSLLQQVRNNFGPTWLIKFKPEVVPA